MAVVRKVDTTFTGSNTGATDEVVARAVDISLIATAFSGTAEIQRSLGDDNDWETLESVTSATGAARVVENATPCRHRVNISTHASGDIKVIIKAI